MNRLLHLSTPSRPAGPPPFPRASRALVLALAAAALPLALLPAAARAEGKAHAHGVATLEVAIDGKTLQIDLETPLDNVVGFERAPRTDAEKRRVQAALERLRNAAQMFAIDPAAQCRPSGTTIVSEVLGLGGGEAAAKAPAEAKSPDAHKGHDDHEGHADLDASYTFECADAARAGFIDVGLFEFKGFARIDVQAVTPKGQLKRTLRRNATRLTFAR